MNFTDNNCDVDDSATGQERLDWHARKVRCPCCCLQALLELGDSGKSQFDWIRFSGALLYHSYASVLFSDLL